MDIERTRSRRVIPSVVEGGVALGVALLAHGLSCLLVWPGPVVQGSGGEWEAMSLDPFGLKGIPSQ